MTDSVPQAEGPNCAETKGDAPATPRGGGPIQISPSEFVLRCRERAYGKRPIRKRGFHRALRRGELWAKTEDMMGHMANQVFDEMWRTALIEDWKFSGLAGWSGRTQGGTDVS